MDNSNDGCAFAGLVGIFPFGVGSMLGGGIKDSQWRNMIVDNPGYIAAVKSSVIAERNLRNAK